MRLTKEQINEYKQVILSGVDGENYGKQVETEKEKIQFVMDCFQAEAYKWQKQKNIQVVFREWLMGLPSALSIPFMNYDIIQLAEKINGIKYTDKQAEKIIENYFGFMTNIFFKLVKQYKIEF
jgi:hypothetical protein